MSFLDNFGKNGKGGKDGKDGGKDIPGIDAFKDMFAKGELTPKKAIALAADQHLTKIKLANNFVTRPLIAGQVKKAFNAAAADFRAGKLDADIAKLSADLKSITRDEIRGYIADKMNVVKDPVEAEKYAEKTQKAMSDMTADEFVALSVAGQAMMPPLVREAYEAVLLDGLTTEAYARKLYAMAPDARLVYQQQMMARLPLDELADFAYAALQKAGEAEMKIVATHVFASVSAGDVSDIVLNGLGFTEDLMKMVKDKNTLGVKNVKQARALGDGVTKVLAAVETGFEKAGILDRSAYRALLAKAKKGGSGPANDNPASPPAPPRFGS